MTVKYSLSLDMRDLDTHVNLFVADIRVSRRLTQYSWKVTVSTIPKLTHSAPATLLIYG